MALTSYDFSNKVKYVDKIVDMVRQQKPTLFTLANIAGEATDRGVYWTDKSLGLTFADVSAVSGLVLTVADGSKFGVGQVLSPVDNANSYAIASISSNDLTVTKIANDMDAPKIGRYKVNNAPQAEITSSGPLTNFQGKQAVNYIQSFRADAEISFIGQGINTYDGANSLGVQMEAALYKVTADINNALWIGRKALGSNALAGSLGGIYEFCTDNNVPASGAALSEALINSCLKDIYDQGGVADSLICNSDQIAAINAIYKSYLKVERDDQVIGTYKTLVQDPYTGATLRIIVDPACPKKDIWFMDSSKFSVVPFSGMQFQVRDSSINGKTSNGQYVYGAYSAIFRNTPSSFGSIRNLA